ncbi:MAG: ATP-binding protein [Acinetobacter sp.]|jgi:predicted ATP-dependent serine protease|uniref:ATP-binding protein n=1 Tax=Acinetobacter junii TaxID=40215 RepID=UPI00125089BC|nr:ATP-binding protein [Acinetobacter junii]
MSTVTMILGQSGTGKSTSLRNLNPDDVLLIQAVRKPLPFRSSKWKPLKEGGCVIKQTNADNIRKLLTTTDKNIIIIDDFQYIMASEFMNRALEKGFDKFTEMAKNAYDILTTAMNLADHKRVYVLSHTEESESGKTKIKTIGKLLDEKITLEGLVTIVLQTAVVNGNYIFLTKNSGQNTVKSPMGLFEDEHIENDLNAVDKAICEYWGIETTEQKLTNETA